MTPRTEMLEVAGLRLRCLRAGDAGPAVVLLHGSGLDAAGVSFGPAMAALAPHCRLYAPDLPGFGESDALPADWGLPEFAAFVGPLFDALRLERASLVGFSLGGGLALLHALAAPERVERLVLVNAALLDDRFPGGVVGAAMSHLLALGPVFAPAMRWPGITRRVLRGAMPRRPDAVEPWLVEAVAKLAERRDALRATRQLQKREVGLRRLRTNAVPRLPELRMPTLLLHGTKDPLVPFAAAERAARLIPDARLEVLEGCGHLAILEDPETTHSALRCFVLDAQR
jgi:pimeloyl-ACP methyl ester carboxylesterase